MFWTNVSSQDKVSGLRLFKKSIKSTLMKLSLPDLEKSSSTLDKIKILKLDLLVKKYLTKEIKA